MVLSASVNSKSPSDMSSKVFELVVRLLLGIVYQFVAKDMFGSQKPRTAGLWQLRIDS